MVNKIYVYLMFALAVVLVILRISLNRLDTVDKIAAKKDYKVLRLEQVRSDLKKDVEENENDDGAKYNKKEETKKLSESKIDDDESDNKSKENDLNKNKSNIKSKKDDDDVEKSEKDNKIKDKEEDSNEILSNEDRINKPVILVAGNHGSGTTLMRAILDVKLNCGYETRVIPEILKFVHEIKHSKNFRLKTKIYSKVINKALALFIVEIMKKNDESHEILCSKDPGEIDLIYLSELFSKLKIIYMVRDGRASVISNLQRQDKSIALSTFYKYTSIWNKINRDLYEQCVDIGEKKCKIVKYENLVTNPETVIREIMDFAGIEFTKEFLRHEEYSSNINKANGKVQNEINTDRLRSWVGKVSYDTNYMKSRFEMFEKFGYEL
jgi:protein-tyrosine sulfotransferase